MTYDPNMVYAECTSTQGNLYLAATERGLAGMWFTDQRHVPDVSSWQRHDDTSQQRVLKQTQQQLEAYFAGELQQFDLPLDLSAGTPFQQAVWQALLKIPFGQTTSYGALSSRIGKPLAVRAVGTAIGAQPDWHHRAVSPGGGGGWFVDRLCRWPAQKRGVFNP